MIISEKQLNKFCHILPLSTVNSVTNTCHRKWQDILKHSKVKSVRECKPTIFKATFLSNSHKTRGCSI